MKYTPKLLVGLAAALSVSAAMAQMTPPEHGPGRPAPHAVTRVQALAMAAERFDKADANKDGVVTPEEREAMRGQHEKAERKPEGKAEHRGPPPGDHAPRAITRAQVLEMAAKRFDQADTNKDGVLSPDEMRAAHEQHGPGGPSAGGPQGEHRGPPPAR